MSSSAVDGGDVKNPAAFRWIDAARYTVALVVTVLIVSVIVNAIKFLTRSEPLHVSVVGGFVSTVRLPPPPEPVVALDFNVRALNPSGRARMYFVNITAYFFDSNDKTSPSTSSHPEFDSMAYNKIPDIVVPQQLEMDTHVRVNATKTTMPDYFNLLYGGGRMKDVTLRLDGTFTTELMYGPNRTSATTYYCDKLLLGGDKDDDAFTGTPNVICSPEHRPR